VPPRGKPHSARRWRSPRRASFFPDRLPANSRSADRPDRKRIVAAKGLAARQTGRRPHQRVFAAASSAGSFLALAVSDDWVMRKGSRSIGAFRVDVRSQNAPLPVGRAVIVGTACLRGSGPRGAREGRLRPPLCPRPRRLPSPRQASQRRHEATPGERRSSWAAGMRLMQPQ
jgi:hypothetical protein